MYSNFYQKTNSTATFKLELTLKNHDSKPDQPQTSRVCSHSLSQVGFFVNEVGQSRDHFSACNRLVQLFPLQ